MENAILKLGGFGVVVVLGIAFMIWVNTLPPVEPIEQLDERHLFVMECTRASGMGSQMIPVCGCIYDNVMQNVELNDKLSFFCLTEAGLIE